MVMQRVVYSSLMKLDLIWRSIMDSTHELLTQLRSIDCKIHECKDLIDEKFLQLEAKILLVELKQ